MTVAIIGASGFIGSNLLLYLASNNLTVIGTCFSNRKEGLIYLDLKDQSAIDLFFEQHAPRAIVYLSGCKDVRKCEEQPEFSHLNNVVCMQNTVHSAEKFCPEATFLYISTDYVFDGKKGNFSISDQPNPKTIYGKDKLAAELILKKSKLNYIVLRTAAVMGKGGVFFEWLISSLKKDEQLEVFSNVYFSPTPIQFFNETVLFLISHPKDFYKTTIHASYPSRLSRFDFAKLCQSILGKDAKAECEPIEMDFEGPYFPGDLSLTPCLPQANTPEKSMEDYLRELI